MEQHLASVRAQLQQTSVLVDAKVYKLSKIKRFIVLIAKRSK
jgi:hypothetical protein